MINVLVLDIVDRDGVLGNGESYGHRIWMNADEIKKRSQAIRSRNKKREEIERRRRRRRRT